MFREVDGGLFLYSYRQLSLAQMIEAIEDLKVNAYWLNHYLPIATNTGDSSYLIVDPQGKHSSTGGLICWSIDEGVVETIAHGLASFLDSLVKDIQEKKVTFQAEKGFIKNAE